MPKPSPILIENCTKRFLLAYCALVVLLAWPGEVYPGAWTQPEGKGIFISNATYYITDNFVDTNGNESDISDYTKAEYNPYIEYGMTPDRTFGMSGALQYLHQEAGAGVTESENFGLSDMEFFVRQRVHQRQFANGSSAVFSLQPLVKIPTGYDSDRTLNLGNGQVDVELRGLAGYGFTQGGRHHFINLEAAYRYRFEAPSDEVRGAAAFGYRLTDDFMVLSQLDGRLALGDGDSARVIRGNIQDADVLKLSLSGVYYFTPGTALQVGAFYDAIARNTGQGSGVLLSIWTEFGAEKIRPEPNWQYEDWQSAYPDMDQDYRL